MIWEVKFDIRAQKEFKKLDKKMQGEILDYFDKRIATKEDPRRFGKPLTYDKKGLWRYRIRDYRVVCKIYDDDLLVLAIKVGHRKNVYLMN
jgi:mRNA interferase RelE/StbE